MVAVLEVALVVLSVERLDALQAVESDVSAVALWVAAMDAWKVVELEAAKVGKLGWLMAMK